MKKEYHLTIKNPCQKIDWRVMQKTESGKFCDLCSKNVVDFSILSDDAIIKIIEDPLRDICAKMSPLQTNRVLNNSSQRKNFHLSKTITTLLLLGSVKSSFANEIKNTPVNHTLLVESLYNKDTKKHVTIKYDSLKNTISGTLIEEYTDEILNYTQIFIKDTNIYTETDSLGNFTFHLPDDFQKDTIILVVKATGWESDNYTTLYRKDLPITNLIVKKEGPIVGEYIIKIKRKWWQFWKKKYY